MDTQNTRVPVLENRQARYQYAFDETIEAGLILEGWEVKSILDGRATFNGTSAFIRLLNNEAWLEGLTITPHLSQKIGLLQVKDPIRSRKLLLQKAELIKLTRKITEKGYTIVPLSIIRRRKLKIVIGVAKGKKLHDKREIMRNQDIQRSIAIDLKELIT